MRWLAVVVVLLVAAPAHANKFDSQAIYNVARGIAPTEGPADAPITIVAFSDYACGYCIRVQRTLDKLVDLYPGVIRWVHRTLPLDEDYTLAAEAALAASAQGAFRPMHARLFALRGRVTRAEAELVARELGLDMIRFRADLDAGTYRKLIAADTADAEKLGVTGTPAFFINGRAVIGAQPLRVFAEVIDEELARADKARAQKPADLYAALVAGGKTAADGGGDDPEPRELDSNTAYRVGLGLPGHQLGSDDALVTIVVWSDFQCPYCQRQAPVLAKLHAKFGDQLRIVHRHLPMANHRDAQLAAEAAVAAGAQGKFWAFHDRIWASFGKLSRADLESFAKAAGVELTAFRAALDDRRYFHAVVAEGAAGEALGVDGTPTMFINGQPVVGSRDETELTRIVEAHLGSAKLVVSKGLAKREIYPLLMGMAKGLERADPATVPVSTAIHIEMRADDRVRSAIAACRRRDPQRAYQLAGALSGDAKRRAQTVCAGEGIDVP